MTKLNVFGKNLKFFIIYRIIALSKRKEDLIKIYDKIHDEIEEHFNELQERLINQKKFQLEEQVLFIYFILFSCCRWIIKTIFYLLSYVKVSK